MCTAPFQPPDEKHIPLTLIIHLPIYHPPTPQKKKTTNNDLNMVSEAVIVHTCSDLCYASLLSFLKDSLKRT